MGLGLKDKLIYVDLFGQGINLTINKMTKSKTFFGGILSIIMMTLVCLNFIFYADDLIYKSNPQSSSEVQMMKIMPNITLTNLSFPFSVSLTNSGNHLIYKPQYFKYHFYYVYGDTSSSVMNFIQLKIKNCTRDNFPLISGDTLDNLKLNQTICIENQNLTISGSWTENFISYISLKVSICLNITEEDKCAPMREIEDYIFSGSYFWKIYYQDTNINVQDLNEPISYVMRNYYKLIKLGSFKIVEFFIRQQTLKSEEGFMYKSQSTYDSLSFDTDKFDDGSFDESTYDLIEFKILASPNKFIVHRSYLKFQTVLASVGGLASLMRLVFTLLSFKFSEMKRNEILLNKIFDFDIRTDIESEHFCRRELKRKLRIHSRGTSESKLERKIKSKMKIVKK
jgi:hypothetical protein